MAQGMLCSRRRARASADHRGAGVRGPEQSSGLRLVELKAAGLRGAPDMLAARGFWGLLVTAVGCLGSVTSAVT